MKKNECRKNEIILSDLFGASIRVKPGWWKDILCLCLISGAIYLCIFCIFGLRTLEIKIVYAIFWTLGLTLVLAMQIFVHELAHLVLAKKYGFKCTEISFNEEKGALSMTGEENLDFEVAMVRIAGPLSGLIFCCLGGISIPISIATGSQEAIVSSVVAVLILTTYGLVMPFFFGTDMQGFAVILKKFSKK